MCTFIQKLYRKCVQLKRRVEKILRAIKIFWSRRNMCVCSWWNKTCMGLEGKMLALYRKKVLGEISCVGKISETPSSRRYMFLPRQFLFGS